MQDENTKAPKCDGAMILPKAARLRVQKGREEPLVEPAIIRESSLLGAIDAHVVDEYLQITFVDLLQQVQY